MGYLKYIKLMSPPFPIFSIVTTKKFNTMHMLFICGSYYISIEQNKPEVGKLWFVDQI